MKTMAVLPNSLSALIDLAIADYGRLDPNLYWPNSDYFHMPRGEDCVVCLSGAVMAGSLGSDVKYDLTPTNFGSDLRAKLSALDAFRLGEVYSALQDLGMDWSDFSDAQRAAIDVVEGHEFRDWVGWDELSLTLPVFARMADELRKVGL